MSRFPKYLSTILVPCALTTSQIIHLFHNIFIREGFQYGYVFAWSVQHGAPEKGGAGTSQTILIHHSSFHPQSSFQGNEEDFYKAYCSAIP